MHPLIVRRVLFPLQEIAKGKPTQARLMELEKSQWLPGEEIAALQLARLRQLLSFAYRQVPYYRRLFDEHRIVPEEIRSLSDFSRIPTLEKAMIRSRFGDLQPQPLPRGVQKMSTGGSTGSPVTVLVDRERAAFTDAARMRAHRWYHADMGEREIVLWGSPIELGGQGRIKEFRDWLINSRLLSAFDMSETRMTAYGEYISRYRPTKMYGYASAFYLLAAFLKKSGWKCPRGLKVIFATAEPLFEFQRSTVEEVFQCSVSAEYGARDAGLMANECPQGGFHIPAEGMLIEIDSSVAGGAGEIIVTNLFSKTMPMIRYRTGDVGELDDQPCPCGRGLPKLKHVQGRQTDFLVTPSGKIVHALAIIYPLREIPAVKQFQVLQDESMQVLIRVVTTPEFSDVDQRRLLAKVSLVLGEGVRISLENVSEIPRSASGKFRYVISKAAESRLGIFAEFHEPQIA